MEKLSDGVVVDTRQVFDLPKLGFEVTEHQLLETRCTCGKTHRGEFPKNVAAPTQYGPRALAAMVHLNQHHMLPVNRIGELMGDLFGLPVSDATIIKASDTAKKQLEPVVKLIAVALQKAPVVHADETGLRVAKTLHWMHVLATKTLTWVGRHAKRGSKAFEELGHLSNIQGTLIHDGLRAYRQLNCVHGLCNAHHLRELTYVFEEMKQPWAGEMITFLRSACHEVDTTPEGLSADRQQEFLRLYGLHLTAGETLNPMVPASGKRGRTKQSKPTNLLLRLRIYTSDVWRFMTDRGVPFTNNIAEQAVRMPKVKQKISGCFRTINGADTFCVIRSYLATLQKQGKNLYESLVATFEGNVPQPAF